MWQGAGRQAAAGAGLGCARVGGCGGAKVSVLATGGRGAGAGLRMLPELAAAVQARAAGGIQGSHRKRAHINPPPPPPPQIRKNISLGWSQLAIARKLEPNLSYQFSIFSREQEHKQRAAGGGSGEQVRAAGGQRSALGCSAAAAARSWPAPSFGAARLCGDPPPGRPWRRADASSHPTVPRRMRHPPLAQLRHTRQAVDLVSYVEFQKNYRSLLQYHKAALEATRDFWRMIMRDRVPVRGARSSEGAPIALQRVSFVRAAIRVHGA